MKSTRVLIILLMAPFLATSQINYHQSPGKITISANSVLLPNTTATASSVSSDNPGSVPTPYSNAFSDQINHLFQFVDRTAVTTGLLKDYGINFTEVERYNGQRTANNYLVMEEWQALYLTLYSYRFQDQISMLHPVQVRETISNYGIQANGGADALSRMVFASSNSVLHHISGLHYQYEQTKPNAVSSNLLYVSNNQIYDTPGRPTSPYELKHAFGFVLPVKMLEGINHRFILKPDLFLTNTGKVVSSIQVDFGDGAGYRTVGFNTPVAIAYADNGIKTVLFRVTYTDSSIFESHQQIEVTGIVSGQQVPQARYNGTNLCRQIFPVTNSGCTGMPNTFPPPQLYQGQGGRALVTIEFGQNNGTTIRRPLMFIEGFDPWQVISPDNPRRNYSYEDLLVGDFDDPVIGGFSLSDLLETNDYDLIFIDFENGADYIQRNAFLVENIIEWVNSVKQPYNGVRQQNVVLGVSMGGLVGRYALKDMENRGINHETRLFCAFDSPHQGANIPLAFQASAAHISNIGIGFGLPGIYYNPGSLTIGNLVPEIGRLAAVSFTPAARQMVKYRVIDQPGELGLTYENSMHDAFMVEYRNLGYPSNTRNLLISNGSECGTNQGYAPYTELMRVDSVMSLPGWANLLATVGGGLAMLTTYPQLTLLALPSSKMDIKAEFILNALPNQQTQRIYKGKVYVKRKVLGLINMNVVLTDESFYSTSSQLPLDNSAGGVYDIRIWAPDLPAGLTPSQNRFSFIPAFSALDIGAGTQTITASDLSATYSPASPPPTPKNVPVNNFITGSRVDLFVGGTLSTVTNENHVQITGRNGRWLFQEIQTSPTISSCAFMCSGETGAVITGPNTVCNTNSTFTLNNVPVGATITWSRSSNLAYVSGQGTTTYTVMRTGSGTGFVSATLTTECGTFLVPQKTFQVGGFSSGDYPVSGPSSACSNQTVYYNTVNLAGATNYSWFWPSDWTYMSGQGTPYLSLTAGTSSGAVGVRVANACDAGGSPATRFTSINNCGYSFSVYPNPAEDELTVSIVEIDSLGNSLLVTSAKNENSEYEVVLFDSKREKVFQLSTKEYTIKIPVKSLPPGLYYLNIVSKEATIQRQILIERK